MDAGSGGDTYVVGLEKSGQAGLITVRLQESTPSPRDTGFYTWTIDIVDASGAPVTGATVQAEPTMPDHGHGTNPKYTDAVEGDPGTYQLTEMNLFMEGIWNVAIRITMTGGEEDQVEYNFFLEG